MGGDRHPGPDGPDATAPDGVEPPVVVITGASRGIGAGMAVHWAGRGLRLALCSRAVPAVPEGAVGADVMVAPVDVRDADAVDRFAAAVVDRFGRIDAWVNNAGVLGPIGPLADADPAALADHVATNVLGVVHGTAAFVRHLRSRPGTGSLVNISSGAATSAYRGWAVYCASKAAVEMLTEVVGLEEQGSGLFAYAVAPGVVDTDMQALIRSTPAARFPDVDRFRQLADDGAFASADWVAASILDRCVDPVTLWRPDPGRGSVRFRVPEPPGTG
jgi:NAD(P)-dependent dehydrogenase (short-subunit alcohol dehydrogenase family)